MSRPLYESGLDRANERAVADVLLERWRCSAVKLPISYELDYALVRDGTVRAWAEVKCRRNARDRYPTYMISLRKVLAGLAMAERTNLPFLLLVQWADALGWVTPSARGIQIGGRHDRGDSADVEPVIHIPIDTFSIL